MGATGTEAGPVSAERAAKDARVVSYRTFKHLLGETSLERKCRFIFGGGILALVTFSFYWYGQKTESLVIGQKTEAARARVEQTVENLHIKKYLAPSNLDSLVDERSGEKSPLNPRPKFEPFVFTPYPTARENRPRDDFEAEALAKFLLATAKGRPNGDGERPIQDSWRIISGEHHEYQYVQAVFFKPSTCAAATTSATRPAAPRPGRATSPSRATSPARSSSSCRWTRRPRTSTATGRS